MSNAIDFSKEEMLEELLNALVDYESQRNRIFEGNTWRNKKEIFGTSLDDEPDMQKIYFNYHQSTAYAWMSSAYDYAVNGIMDESLDRDWEVLEDDYFSYISDINQSLFFERNNSNGVNLKKCMKIINLARARYWLDFGKLDFSADDKHAVNYIDISNIAVLSGLDERTIRNMTNPKNKNHLKTEKKGNKTYISIEVAKEWLANRGFKKTVMAKANTHRDLEKFGFRSVYDLAQFLEDTSEHNGIKKNEHGHYKFSSNAVSKYVGDIIECKKMRENETEEKFIFDFDILKAAAEELAVNKVHFLDSCFKLHQECEKVNYSKKLAA
ncbi:hypothetical protein [Crenobacter intestini]|uniref:Uncharacterized protein n=1 Tax=Crenobacter intestini TaxID=2563443 RepID=A0A4V4N745_9NEIS|nr:hypothetical protein [Crenobacter intestini]TIC78493.1 hypothetical protein E5K04_16080 [Crenobacter intestini]